MTRSTSRRTPKLLTPPTKLENSGLERAREHAPATMAVLEATGGWDAVADRAEAEENARRESIARVEKKLRRGRPKS